MFLLLALLLLLKVHRDPIGHLSAGRLLLGQRLCRRHMRREREFQQDRLVVLLISMQYTKETRQSTVIILMEIQERPLVTLGQKYSIEYKLVKDHIAQTTTIK